MPIRICIIVDNPLRDLDGLVLVAWHLAKMNFHVYLVPMYAQISDVKAISPDFILANYVRANNVDTLKRFKALGIKIGVLDTEGVSGKNTDEFAKLVKKGMRDDIVDLYCLRGNNQYQSFTKYNVLPKHKIKVTGCPRYDFCNKSLVQALPSISDIDNYVLINTNFPTANPRFTRSSEDEISAMIKVGFGEDFAKQFVHDAKITYKNVIKVVRIIAKKNPSQNFVIRPHPFENIDAYSELLGIKNIFIRQEGTSLEWINSSICLIHLNCSTSIEAAMLGKEALSLEWLNTPALSVPMAGLVSRKMNSERQLHSTISSIIKKISLDVNIDMRGNKRSIVNSLYAGNDGKSAERVAEEIFNVVTNKSSPNYKSKIKPISDKAAIIFSLQVILGYKAYTLVRNIFKSQSQINLKSGKSYSRKGVDNVLKRINIAYNDFSVKSTVPEKIDIKYNRLFSGKSIKIFLK